MYRFIYMEWHLEELQNWIENGCDAEIANEVKKLNIGDRELTEIPKEVFQLVNLTHFFCYENMIEEIPKEIGKLVNLEYFGCGNNLIKEIPKEIMNCKNLYYFNFRYNKITEIPIEIINCKKLLSFIHNNNPIYYYPPQIKRWIYLLNNPPEHNHYIKGCIKESINYIMKFKPNIDELELKEHIMNNDKLKLRVKDILLLYCEDRTVHSDLKITFDELLLSVYDFILKHENKDAIFEILNKEMINIAFFCNCFESRISRLIYILNGFDDNIVIDVY